jgi:phosphohistidine phosphatase
MLKALEMKKIIFVRHGRAEEQTSPIPDFERSLTTKGKIISEQMALILKKKEEDPGIFITSPAFRAYETALVFARVFGKDPDKILIRSNLYNRASLNYFAEILDKISGDVDSIILFGHNPSFTEIPDRLSKEGCDFLPKSGIAGLSFKTDSWKGIIHERGKIEYFLKPEKTL